jgi:hypothetical protein
VRELAHRAHLIALLAFIGLLPGQALANQAPIIDELSASPSVPAPDEIVTLTLRAHDPDCADTCTSECGTAIDAGLTAWSATGGTFLGQDNGVESSPYVATAQWQAPSSEGTYTISVFVSDNGGFFCGGRLDVTPTLDIQVATQTSEPPVIDSLTATPLQLLSGQTSDLLCSATDPDGDPVSYSWDTDSGTVTPGVGGAAVFTAGDPGVATVTCTATDPGGAFGLDTIALSVTGAVADSMITSGLITPRRLSADPWGNVYVVDRSPTGPRSSIATGSQCPS